MTTVSAFIDDVLGGTSAAARELGVLPSAVSNYKAAGRFPERLHRKLVRLASERSVELPDSLFEPDAPEPAQPAPTAPEQADAGGRVDAA